MRRKTPGTPDADHRVLLVCRLLNEAGVNYLIAGGVAANLHGTFRSTKDVDLLIPKNEENTEKLLEALGELPYGIAKELDAKHVTARPFTIIGDSPRVDLLTVAWNVTYEKAKARKRTKKILGVRIPYLSLADLIQSKQTGRHQDLADLEILKKRVRKKK